VAAGNLRNSGLPIAGLDDGGNKDIKIPLCALLNCFRGHYGSARGRADQVIERA
jgi:hypothetical protein